MTIYWSTNNWWQNGQGVIITTAMTMKPGDDDPTGQFYLWSPLMIFSLIMAIIVGLLIIALLLYALFYFCMYGTCCCMPGGAGCWWCPQQQAGPASDEPVKVRIRRPSRSESCRSSVRSTCSHHSDGRMVRINSCPSISESCGGPQPIIIQTIPALPAPQPSTIQPVMAPAPPAPSCGCHNGGCGGGCRGGNNSNFGGGELRVVIGDAKPAASSNRSGGSVLVYDMGRSNGGGVSLGGGGGGLSLGAGRSEYVLTSVDDNHYGGSYRKSGAFNEGFDRDEGGSCFSDGHRSAVIDIGKGGNFYPSLPQYDD